MRISVIALGSRGDIQPYLALGKGLQEAGIDTRLVSHEDFEPLARSHGLAFHSMRGNVQKIIEREELSSLLEKGNIFTITAQMSREVQRIILNWVEDGLAGCRDADLLLTGFGGLFVTLALAEKLHRPMMQAHYIPFTPTQAFPSIIFPPASARLGKAFNLLSHHLTRQMTWQSLRVADGTARQQILGLPRAPFFGPYHAAALNHHPILYGFSPSILPRPSDWGGNIHVTGYWFLDAQPGWAPPAGLTDFLQSGPPPVYIGFGSMSNRDPQATARLVLEALAITKQRAILLAGWGGLHTTEIPENVYIVDSVPHDWLFPRMAAVVHHGGAGTTAAGLRAGVPSIIIPFFGDQPFWGQRVADLGIGPAPIPRKKLTAANLAQAIQAAVTDQDMRRRAHGVGASIRAEDGVGNAVAIIKELIGHLA